MRGCRDCLWNVLRPKKTSPTVCKSLASDSKGFSTLDPCLVEGLPTAEQYQSTYRQVLCFVQMEPVACAGWWLVVGGVSREAVESDMCPPAPQKEGFSRLGAHAASHLSVYKLRRPVQLHVAQQTPSDVEVASYDLVPESSNAGIIKKGEPHQICAN